jgi:hypothetical protein
VPYIHRNRFNGFPAENFTIAFIHHAAFNFCLVPTSKKYAQLRCGPLIPDIRGSS